eukprot:CAMPEP_0174913286 /NCGR_PEP_ID=MMETSP0167-20121228/80239_1 /TAXON_ID=38298 /ORGANISM="Rhodella maculata, Strain CCMP736" /LENGTH=226 /DNA_ID=CAMNT_0016158001 /DNA_START=118 /DNA_END=798 /DNA_ORIENTATION=+
MSSSNAKFQNPNFVTKNVNDYVLRVGFRETPIAEELRLATANHPRGGMMGDPTEAAMFKVLLPAIGAKNVIEVGVFTGYSTLVMAEALGQEGKILALDYNEEFVSIGRPYWEKAGVADRIDVRIAPAGDTLQKLLDEGQEGAFDFAFIDADKTNYKTYYEIILKLLRKNGIIAIDNVLWYGKVLDQNIQDEDTVALREISEYVFRDERVEHVMLPFADGVTLVRKK